ncbi:Zinc finger MYM-type protein 1, partial [Frankliniella fusca]
FGQENNSYNIFELASGWLEANSEENVMKGQPEAYCKACEKPLRAQHADLLKHSKTGVHKSKAAGFNRSTQPSLHNYGCVEVSEPVKHAEMKLAVFVAAHASVKTMDHLGELLSELGKGSPLANVKCHRTKCSKLIQNVVAPEYQKELLEDIGNAPYALITDEVTDLQVCKFMGVCVRYFSRSKKEMVTDFLGLIPVLDCTGQGLANSLKEYLKSIGLPLKRLMAVGVDGASNMCGPHNSFFTHLRTEVPNLQLFKCVCHSIDKCAQHAFDALPNDVASLINDTNNWFAHSAKRWGEYEAYYKTINGGKKPKKLMSLSKTRWLVWVPCSEIVLNQWHELRGFFLMKAEGAMGDKKAKEIVKLYSTSNNLYLLFLQHVLQGVQTVSSAFERTNADITKLYADLRSQILVLAGRILDSRCILQAAQPGMLRSDEIRMLKEALGNRDNYKPLNRISVGDSFNKKSTAEKVPEDELNGIRNKCGQYVFTLTKLLLNKLPTNVDAVSKLKHFIPTTALSRSSRPTFQQLPTEIAEGEGFDLSKLESQWELLGTLTFPDICDGQDPEKIDIVRFWSCVLDVKNAGGEHTFKELALFVLKALTLPISNAVVERVFSVLSCLKCRRRNRLQLAMLEALIRVRVHLKVIGQCCTKFQPSKSMYKRFTVDMYRKHIERVPAPAPTAPSASTSSQPDYQGLEEWLVDNPDSDEGVLISIPENDEAESEELCDIDYEIVNELDTEVFNEDLLVVRL